jgi:hypothetical protein
MLPRRRFFALFGLAAPAAVFAIPEPPPAKLVLESDESTFSISWNKNYRTWEVVARDKIQKPKPSYRLMECGVEISV